MPATKPYLHLQHWFTIGELLRISNLPTAWADVVCGWFIGVHYGSEGMVVPGNLAGLLGLLISSSGLYLSGMAWNDFFDAAVDAVERPWRPIPSGRISRQTAAAIASGMMLTGILAAGLTSWWNATCLPLALSGCLALLILAYDGSLKQNWTGPFVLGACRFLNVILGGSLTPDVFSSWLLYVAATNGVYVIGVSSLARGETGNVSRAWFLASGLFLTLSFLMTLATRIWPIIGVSDYASVSEHPHWSWFVWWTMFAWWGVGLVRLTLGVRCRQTPGQIQQVVGKLLARITVLDALLAAAIVGPVAYLIAVLMVPAWWLRRFFAPS
jgi:hypothetical protein